MKHTAVATCGVVGKPDPMRTEIVKAYIVLRDGVAPTDDLADQIMGHVAQHLSTYARPREVAFVPSLPMTVTGKVIRKELRARAREETP